MTRVVVDATPLLGRRTGIGRHVTGLLAALADGVRAARPGYEGLDLVASPVTLRPSRPADLPEGVGWRAVPAPAGLLHRLWARGGGPPADLLVGPADVHHATNFVLPPTRAAGVVTVHDLAFDRDPSVVTPGALRYRRLVPVGLRRARVVLTVSRAVRDQVLERYGLDPDRVLVTPNGVDPSWVRDEPTPDDRRRLGLPERYVVFVGTLEPRKNLAWLLRAHRLARQRHGADVPDLVLCGAAGWQTQDAVGARDGDGVVRTGFLPHEDLRRAVSGAQSLVLPSRDEGFGLPVLEAMACGVPVVCTDLPVLREVAGGLAATVPLDDDDALAAALADLPGTEPPGADRERLVAHAGRWTWQACADATVRAYALALTR